LILSSFFLFNACNKDALIGNESIEYRSDYESSSEMINDFYNYFISKKSTFQIDDLNEISPFYYDLKKETAYIPLFFNDTAVIFNVSANPIRNFSKYMSNQILVKKNRLGKFEISNIIYFADSVYYASKGFDPLVINFTGYLVEINSSKKLESIYKCQMGEITKSLNQQELSIVIDNLHMDQDISLRDAEYWPPKWWRELWDIITCPSFGGSSGSIWEWFGKVFSGGEGGNGSNNYSWTTVIKWGDPTNTGWQSGGGGSGGTSALPCQNPKTFWDTYGKPSYKNYVEALSILIKEFGISLCDDIFSNSSGCSVSYDNILCGTADCISSLGSTYLSLDQLLGCLRSFISNVADNDRDDVDCQMALKQYNKFHATNLTLYDILDVWDGDPNICGNWEKFNCETNKLMFFKRSDIQQIIADNAIIDPCNPDLTSKDILTDYVNNNCQEGICTMPLDEILKKTGGIQEDKSLQNCPFAYCVYEALFRTKTKLFCETFGNLFDDQKITTKISVKKLGNPAWGGTTIYNEKTGIIEISISDFNCNYNSSTSDIDMAATFLHEAFHAEMKRELLDLGYNPNEIDNYEKLWGAYYVEYYKKHGNDINNLGHAIMVWQEKFISKLADALWKLNGELLTSDHYKYFAWQGLEHISPYYMKDQNWLTNPRYCNYLELYNELKVQDPLLDLGCNKKFGTK